MTERKENIMGALRAFGNRLGLSGLHQTEKGDRTMVSYLCPLKPATGTTMSDLDTHFINNFRRWYLRVN